MRRRTRVELGVLALIVSTGIAACSLVRDQGDTPPTSSDPISIPLAPVAESIESTRVAVGLDNPRGILALSRGELLVALAGTGEGNSGALVALRDLDHDGSFGVANEMRVLLDGQPSANAVDIVRRDEVFGPAAIAAGGGDVMATVAFFGGPSRVLRIDGHDVAEWGKVHGNLNSITYDEHRHAWYAASSTSDEIVRLRPGKGADRVIKLAPLDQGQDPVPGYLRYDPSRRDILVSLFSGSVLGEEGGSGSEIALRAGQIVRIDPDSRATAVVVNHLTAPTDLGLDRCGRVYVLEMCDQFLDPIENLDDIADTSHGGFRRFSGRLLRIDPETRAVRVLANGLDAPTNLAVDGSALYVSGGMGTPGRTIPGPDGPTPLVGYIDRFDLGPLPCEEGS